MTRFSKDDLVVHPAFGQGRVRYDDGGTVLVRFEHGVEECVSDDLRSVQGVERSVLTGRMEPALPVVARVLSNAISSVNDAWGVFSRSRISLLPHQLWVCKQVLETWPTRWMVADDVGLGKTIEAGLILTPLLASGRVRRVLIIAPASLVEQWHQRLREMFDIRMSIYDIAVDTDRSDYWNTHDKVVASAQTLRLDSRGRWDRLVGAAPWDLVMVDEAHHMNATEDGRTLAFQLAERLQTAGRIRSLVLFTGTPHRGKDFGFLALLRLLRPDDFDPRLPLEAQLAKLRSVVIRNNKQHVTDMVGNPLFTPIHPHLETYDYSNAEATFYEKLTQFIASGRAYASGLGQRQQRTAILVLITMQKLASSSVAAVRRALKRRLARLQGAAARQEEYRDEMFRLEQLIDEDDPANADEMAELEEILLEGLGDAVRLNPAEIPALEELIEAADSVERETKVDRLLDVVEQRFGGDTAVLFFTEYKATQALVMSALIERYGDGCVAFINGDGFIEGVRSRARTMESHREDRHLAADRFNAGAVRFLVSTEAAGEGIDLQENCCSLIHVDLPWNPMRLHQRVGRLSRYGQKKPVEVVSVRNPSTVESRIWECLDQKLDRITLAFQGAMDDPEDMRQLVLGMASPRMFTSLFADAKPESRGESLQSWFDARTATFGGAGAVSAVRALFGNVARFDFGKIKGDLPRVDLPDLLPFVRALLVSCNRRPVQSDLRLSFLTPEAWVQADFAIAERYELVFARDARDLPGKDLAGVGQRVVDRALRVAADAVESLAALDGLERPVAVFTVRDRVTGGEGLVRKTVVATQLSDAGWQVLRDWEVIGLLNPLADKPRSLAVLQPAEAGLDLQAVAKQAGEYLGSILATLDLPYRVPVLEPLALLVPAKALASALPVAPASPTT